MKKNIRIIQTRKVIEERTLQMKVDSKEMFGSAEEIDPERLMDFILQTAAKHPGGWTPVGVEPNGEWRLEVLHDEPVEALVLPFQSRQPAELS